ncbi:MAG: SDR family NAD(P)-dependent oxidoreductase, partial [bacterium]
MEKVCVTGGAGFIGSNLVHRLIDKDCEVVVIDDFSTGRKENLENIQEKIELFKGDIRSQKLLGEALEGVDTVFHQAALPSVPRSMEEPVKTTDVTLMGTVHLLEQAAEAGVDTLVYASSSSVYGNQPGFPRSENMSPHVRSTRP